MTFLDFIETQPGIQRYAFHMYERIEKAAAKAASQLKGKDIAFLRAQAISPALKPSLRAQNKAMADALEQDPSGLLATIPSLRSWAARYDIDQHWITWYRRYVVLWLADQNRLAPPLVPMMVERGGLEAVS